MAVADFNNDGEPDVFVGWATIGTRGRTLLVNNHPRTGRQMLTPAPAQG